MEMGRCSVVAPGRDSWIGTSRLTAVCTGTGQVVFMCSWESFTSQGKDGSFPRIGIVNHLRTIHSEIWPLSVQDYQGDQSPWADHTCGCVSCMWELTFQGWPDRALMQLWDGSVYSLPVNSGSSQGSTDGWGWHMVDTAIGMRCLSVYHSIYNPVGQVHDFNCFFRSLPFSAALVICPRGSSLT